MKKLREDNGHQSDIDERDDDGAWRDWDIESDSSVESSDGWVDVESDEGDLDISDSEDENAPVPNLAPLEANITPVSSLATRKVCNHRRAM